MKPRHLALLLLTMALPHAMFAESKEAAPPEKSASRPEPSEAFRAYVQSVRIDGVFVGYNSGAQNRAMVNKRLTREGDVIEGELGVRLVSIETKVLVFEDKSGARLQKAYEQGK